MPLVWNCKRGFPDRASGDVRKVRHYPGRDWLRKQQHGKLLVHACSHTFHAVPADSSVLLVLQVSACKKTLSQVPDTIA